MTVNELDMAFLAEAAPELFKLRDEEARQWLESVRQIARVQERKRAISHHGSDCSIGCDGNGYCRALTLTRFTVWPKSGGKCFDIAALEGDIDESDVYLVVVPIGESPFCYGGGFWEKVSV